MRRSISTSTKAPATTSSSSRPRRDRPCRADEARALCDRRFGVGADGVLLVTPGSGDARASMVVLNADGSRPEMCGNGLRCVALHLARRDGMSASRDRSSTPTPARSARASSARAPRTREVTVGMGRGRLLGESDAFRCAGREQAFTLVSMGNPHAVVFDLDLDAPEMDRLGPALSAATTGGINVESVTARGGDAFRRARLGARRRPHPRLRNGRGCRGGRRRGDGTRAAGERVEVRLPGGPLFLTVRARHLRRHADRPGSARVRGQGRLVNEAPGGLRVVAVVSDPDTVALLGRTLAGLRRSPERGDRPRRRAHARLFARSRRGVRRRRGGANRRPRGAASRSRARAGRPRVRALAARSSGARHAGDRARRSGRARASAHRRRHADDARGGAHATRREGALPGAPAFGARRASRIRAVRARRRARRLRDASRGGRASRRARSPSAGSRRTIVYLAGGRRATPAPARGAAATGRPRDRHFARKWS